MTKCLYGWSCWITCCELQHPTEAERAASLELRMEKEMARWKYEHVVFPPLHEAR